MESADSLRHHHGSELRDGITACWWQRPNLLLGRMVLLSKMEETLVCGTAGGSISRAIDPGAIHPQGHLHLKEFRQDPFPVFVV